MTVTAEGLALGYAFSVGAASFFSPCSVGLLPAYVAYFVAAGQPGDKPQRWSQGLARGLKLGLAGSAGFFVLFAALALILRAVSLKAFTPQLPYVSIAIGAIIALLGVFLLAGRSFSVRLPTLAAERSQKSIFLFGFAYALASLGCTFPFFLSVVLAGFATGGALAGALSLVAYALGMAVVMTTITTTLALSEESATRFIRKATPLVTKIAAAAMVLAGIYIVIFWVRTLKAIA